MTVLDEIVAAKRRELAQRQRDIPAAQLRAQIADAPAPRDFSAALSRPGEVALIAEVKRASPSKGLIRADFDPVAIARAYADNGAACISVLTDQPFFQGALEHLRQIRPEVETPLLRKDFLLDAYQVLEARAAGADAVLLIAECLDDCLLRGLLQAAEELGMSALVEFYDEENLSRVVDAGATLIGVNNRNLHTFETDIQHSLRMRERLPADCIFVAESGIAGPEQVAQLRAAGVDAMLVGEHLMRGHDIGLAVRQLLGRQT